MKEQILIHICQIPRVKFLVFTLFYCILTLSATAQFEVVAVRGIVRYNNTEQVVKIGDKVSRNVDLQFMNPEDDLVAIYNSQQGRILLPEKERINYYNMTLEGGNINPSGPTLRSRAFDLLTEQIYKKLNGGLILRENSFFDIDKDSANRLTPDERYNMLKMKVYLYYKYKSIVNNRIDTVKHKVLLVDYDQQNKDSIQGKENYSFKIPNLQKLTTKEGAVLNDQLLVGDVKWMIVFDKPGLDKKPRAELKAELNYLSNNDPIYDDVEIIMNAQFTKKEPMDETYKLIYDHFNKKLGTPLSYGDVIDWIQENYTFVRKKR